MNKTQVFLYLLIVVLTAIPALFIASKFSKNSTLQETTSQTTTQNKVKTSKPTKSKDKNEYYLDFPKLKIRTLKQGSGDREVKNGDTITVQYVGRLSNGKKFDSSYDHRKPFTFTVGKGTVIEGWEKGVLGMKVGEKRQLKIPSKMAYGEKGFPPTIPPKTGLIFEITLIKID